MTNQTSSTLLHQRLPVTVRSKMWLAAFALALNGCAISTPYRESNDGQGAQVMAGGVVAITEATLAFDPDERAAFWNGVRQVERELPRQRGLVGFSLRKELFGDRVWTMTHWTSEADLERFVSSSVHQGAMAMGSGAIAKLRFARLTMPPGRSAISWDEALTALGQGQASYEHR